MTKKEMLRDTMYRMFKSDTIPFADMDDFEDMKKLVRSNLMAPIR
jgi:hypothetical protein